LRGWKQIRDALEARTGIALTLGSIRSFARTNAPDPLPVTTWRGKPAIATTALVDWAARQWGR